MTKSLGDHRFTRPPEKKPIKKDDRPWTVVLGQYIGLSTQNVSVIAFFGLTGWYLDKKLETTPYLLVAGLFFGAAVGFYNLIRILHQMQKNADE